MKVTIEVDCTPEEARRAMGLPDFTAVHEKYVAGLVSAMDNGIAPELLESMLRSWSPMGEAGIAAWQKMFEFAVSKPASGSSD